MIWANIFNKLLKFWALNKISILTNLVNQTSNISLHRIFKVFIKLNNCLVLKLLQEYDYGN